MREAYIWPCYGTDSIPLVELEGRRALRGAGAGTGAPCNKGVGLGDVGTGPNSRTEQNRPWATGDLGLT